MGKPLGRSGLVARYIEVSEPTKEPTPSGPKEAAEVASEEEAVALDKGSHSKAGIVAKAKRRPVKRRSKRRAKVTTAPEPEPYPW